MYAVDDEKYCYRGTTVLKNKANLRSQERLTAFETMMTVERFSEPLPEGRFSPSHYRAIHRHIFQDVYGWAGRYRSVRIGKAGSPFCYPEHIPAQMRDLLAALKRDRRITDLPADLFAEKAAAFLATLNAIHPFRDGNGRAQTAFLLLLADEAGHSVAMERFEPDMFKAAMVASFFGDEKRLAAELLKLVT